MGDYDVSVFVHQLEQIYTLVGDVYNGATVHESGREGCMRNLCTFCSINCEPKTALKSRLIFKNWSVDFRAATHSFLTKSILY